MRAQLDILLIEDNEGDVEMTRRALNSATPACQLSVANSGDQALEYLNEGTVAPQLILLDINMPRMDGKAFLEEVKTSEAFRRIPVVMFTSSESSHDIRDCYDRQANGYVVKPFDGQQYAERIREVVNFWGTINTLSA